MPPTRTLSPAGDEIRARRVRLGLTCAQLAARIGRHRQTIARIEAGRQALASDVLINQIANALGAEPEEIIRHDVNGTAA